MIKFYLFKRYYKLHGLFKNINGIFYAYLRYFLIFSKKKPQILTFFLHHPKIKKNLLFLLLISIFN